MSQWNGRSPVCLRWCSTHSFLRMNDFPQMSHMWITRSLLTIDSTGLGASALLPACARTSRILSVSLERASFRQLLFDSRDKNASPSSQSTAVTVVLMLEVTIIGLLSEDKSGRSPWVNECTSQSPSCSEGFVKLTSSRGSRARHGWSSVSNVISSSTLVQCGTTEVLFSALW